MVCAREPVPPGPAAICSMARTATAFLSLNTRTPLTGSLDFCNVTGISSPSRANTV